MALERRKYAGQAWETVAAQTEPPFTLKTTIPSVDEGQLISITGSDDQPLLAYDSGGELLLFAGDGLETPLSVFDCGGFTAAPSGQTGDIQNWWANGTKFLRFLAGGFLGIRQTAAPADGVLDSSELSIWLDATPGATKVMFKAKDSGGTVRTGSVNLI